jgi:hypothetical protein
LKQITIIQFIQPQKIPSKFPKRNLFLDMGQTNFEKALLVASTAKQTQSPTHTLTNTTELYNK